MQADLCVIGGGFAGLTCALEAQRRGLEVVVLEAERAGWGASGRNAGIVSAGFALGYAELIKAVGDEDAWTIAGLSETGAQYVRKQIERLKIKNALHGEGLYRVSRREAAREVRAEVELCGQKLGHELRYCSREEVREVLRTDRYHEAAYDPNAFTIQPLAYALGLAKAFVALGGVLFEQTRAQTLSKQGGRWRVVSAGGAVDADNVVMCTSAYELKLYRPVSRALLPVATYMVASEPAPDVVDQVIATEAAVVDTRHDGDYFRRLPDGRLLWGSFVSTSRSEPVALGERLLVESYKTFNRMGRLKAARSWMGLMGYARHKMPLIGQVEPSLWHATGFGGHGLNTTAMAGHLIAQAISEGDDRYKLFARFGLTPAGGPARKLARQSGFWALRARDKLNELF